VNYINLKDLGVIHSKKFNFYFFKSEDVRKKHVHWELVNHRSFCLKTEEKLVPDGWS
jgi:hypothetical protein